MIKRGLLSLGIVFLFLFNGIPIGFAESSGEILSSDHWFTYAHDYQHTSRAPVDSSSNNGTIQWIYEPEDVLDPELQCQLEGEISFAADGTIYVGTWDGVRAVNPDNGEEIWRCTQREFDGGITVDQDGMIYTGNYAGKLYAIYPNGTVKWTYSQGSPTGSYGCPIINDGFIYYASRNRFSCLYKENGTMVWNVTGEFGPYNSPAFNHDKTVIYLTNGWHNLKAYNPSNGSILWTTRIGTGYPSNPSIGDDGTIYVSCSGQDTNPAVLTAVQPNGSIIWSVDLGDYGALSTPTLLHNGNIVTDCRPDYSTNLLLCYSPEGQRLWEYDMESYKIYASNCRVVDENDIIYFAACNMSDDVFVYSLNPDGSERWRHQLRGDGNINVPTMAMDMNGILYVSTTAFMSPTNSVVGQLYALGPGPRRDMEVVRPVEGHTYVFDEDRGVNDLGVGYVFFGDVTLEVDSNYWDEIDHVDYEVVSRDTYWRDLLHKWFPMDMLSYTVSSPPYSLELDLSDLRFRFHIYDIKATVHYKNSTWPGFHNTIEKSDSIEMRFVHLF